MSKKKKEISLEEKMEQALVPADEQPYEVPENWCWGKLKNFTEIITGKKDANYGKDGGEYFFFTCASEPIKCPDYSFDCSAILLAGNGDISNISRYDGKFEAYQRTYVVQTKENMNRDYLYFYFKYRWVDYNIDKMFGTAIPYIRLGNLNEFQVPIAPIEEQKRIVKVIESMFAKLDEAKEIAEEIVEESLGYRASIYHAAFNGDLSKAWRKKNNISDDTWNIKRFDEVAEIKSNLVDPSDYQSFPHIAPDSIEKRTGRLLDYRTIEEDGVTSGKHRFYKGQILYSKIRPYLSKLVVVDFDGLCSADMYPIEVKENTKYLWHYMLSDDFLLQASSAGSRSVLPKINQKELSALKISIPSVSEQEEIVRVLDNVLEKHNIMMERAELVIEQIDVMKKSILAKAFRGELGTNIESEENSIELLKQILEVS